MNSLAPAEYVPVAGSCACSSATRTCRCTPADALERQAAIVEAHARGDRATVARLVGELVAEMAPKTQPTPKTDSVDERALDAALRERISNAWIHD